MNEEAPKVPKPDVKDMSPEEIDCAKEYRDITLTTEQFAERRVSELADEFTRLEVQIATILLAFGGLFVNSFSKGISQPVFSHYLTLLMKFSYSFGIFFLIMSLILGLIHLKRKEHWWNGFIEQRSARLNKWMDVLGKDVSFKEAMAFHDGTALGAQKTSFSPIWTWALQTICLGISVVLLFIIFLVFLFHT